jgi:hypothetical protein
MQEAKRDENLTVIRPVSPAMPPLPGGATPTSIGYRAVILALCGHGGRGERRFFCGSGSLRQD